MELRCLKHRRIPVTVADVESHRVQQLDLLSTDNVRDQPRLVDSEDHSTTADRDNR